MNTLNMVPNLLKMKRNHKSLTLKEKCQNGKSISHVAKIFRIPKSTVFKIKKNKSKINS